MARARKIARAAVCGLLLAAGGTWASPPARAASAASASPFRDATVRHEPGQPYVVSWRAAGVRRVEVYASGAPDMAGARRLGAAGAGAQLRATLPAQPRWWFELKPDHGAPLILAERSLHIQAANARDAGGYPTRDGRWIRMGAAYRSNALDRLSPADVGKLQALKLRTVVDLRTDLELARAPDAAIPGAEVVRADVMADDRVKAQAFFKPRTAPLTPQDIAALQAQTREAYRDFVRTASARKAYHELFARLADPQALPVMFHCTAGKDRTGWAEAVLLTILGAPRPVVVHDYALSSRYLGTPATARELTRALAPDASLALRRRLIAADPADLATAFDEVDRDYGSFDNYLHAGLGLTDAQLASIRRNFLTP